MNSNQPQPRFPGMADAQSNFDASRQALRSKPFYTDIDLSAARTATNMLMLPIAGNVLYIDQKQNGGTARVHFQDQTPTSTPITVFPGFIARIPYTQIAIENDAQPGVTMRLVFGTDLDFAPGSGAGLSLLNAVSVIDGSLLRSLQGQAFWKGFGVGATAAKLSGLILWNEVGSGKKLVVNKIRATRETAAGFLELQEITAVPPTPVAFGRSKNMGGTPSTAGRYYTDSTLAALPGTTILEDYFVLNVSGEYVMSEPLVVSPGTGIGVFTPDVLQQAHAHFQWFEIGA